MNHSLLQYASRCQGLPDRKGSCFCVLWVENWNSIVNVYVAIFSVIIMSHQDVVTDSLKPHPTVLIFIFPPVTSSGSLFFLPNTLSPGEAQMCLHSATAANAKRRACAPRSVPPSLSRGLCSRAIRGQGWVQILLSLSPQTSLGLFLGVPNTLCSSLMLSLPLS